MRALRSTIYIDGKGVSTVMREDDVIDTLESIAIGLDRIPEPACLTLYEIVDVPDELSFEQTVRYVMAQRNERDELNQAMLYEWTVAWFERLHDDGAIFMDKSAPLSREQIVVVFEQLARHPGYRNFTITSHTSEGDPVTLTQGKVQP